MPQSLFIPRLKDKNLIDCLKILGDRLSSKAPKASIGILGPSTISFDPANCEDSEDLQAIAQKNSTLIYTAGFSAGGYSFQFYRGGRNEPKSPFTDEIYIGDNNSATLSAEEKLEVAFILTKTLKAFDPERSIGNKFSKEQAELASIHEATLSRLETLNEELIASTHKYRAKLDEELTERTSALNDEHKVKLAKLETEKAALLSEIKKKEDNLESKKKELDDKSNTHARRQIRKDIIHEIKRRQTDFTLTNSTNNLRRPISAMVFVAITLLCIAAYLSFQDLSEALASGTAYQAIAAGIRQVLYSAGAFGTVLFYIRWQNRWFEQHSQAEFHLKQLELDMERASWIVETGLEWKDIKGSTMPIELLESLSRNLFIAPNEKVEKAIHPADQLASALMGTASSIKLKTGDSELLIDPRKLNKASE